MRIRSLLCLGLSVLAIAAGACSGTGTALGPNSFLTLTETLGVSASAGNSNSSTGGGGGNAATTTFRRTMTVTVANQSDLADLNVNMLAWVKPSSIRSAEQQDALLSNGYIQLSQEARIGTVFTLVPGTFVLQGTGSNHAIAVRLAKAAAAGTPTEQAFDMITPDVVLLYSQPPVSCDSVGFTFTIDGRVVTDQLVDVGMGLPLGEGLGLFEGSTRGGGFKTLAQFDAYECDPFNPGYFLKIGGGERQPNEFFEGESIRVDFFQMPNAEGNAAITTIG